MQLTPTEKSSLKSIPNVSALDAAAHPRHRWYFFKEAFSPEIVQKAINDKNLTKGQVLFDPFCGSGTTPLTAASMGLVGRATEVNPFLKFVADAKLQEAEKKEILVIADKVKMGIQKGAVSSLEKFSTFSEHAHASKQREKWLFNSKVLRAFEGGWRSIKNANPENQLLRLCLIGAAMDSANAQKDGKMLRYKKGWEDLKFDKRSFLEAFEIRLLQIAEDIETSPIEGKSSIRNIDIRKASVGKFDLCVTSPPYLNSFDYTDVYRPELFLGRFVSNMEQLRALRLQTLRSHVQVKWHLPKKDDFGIVYKKTIDDLNNTKIEFWDKRLPLMIQSYFEDIEKVLKKLKESATPKASLWIVVSNSAYCGIEIPVDLIMAEIGARLGWLLREVTVLRHLSRASFQQQNLLSSDLSPPLRLRESVIIFDKA